MRRSSFVITSGSSPHARGTPVIGRNTEASNRFIPACAGNAPESGLESPLTTVHPRMRGERISGYLQQIINGGSSPHARGTPLNLTQNIANVRFIPACAGNAYDASVVASTAPVHPRMRGERQYVHQDVDVTVGSSPHARGTRGHAGQAPQDHRFIPACAGNACGRRPSARRTSVHPRMRGERVPGVRLSTATSGSSPHARGTRHSQGVAHARHRFIPACAGNALPISY